MGFLFFSCHSGGEGVLHKGCRTQTVKRKIHQDLFHIVNKTSLASSCVLYLPDWK